MTGSSAARPSSDSAVAGNAPTHDVFALRDSVVDEYKRFATSFTTIHAHDIREQVEAIYAVVSASASGPRASCASARRPRWRAKGPSATGTAWWRAWLRSSSGARSPRATSSSRPSSESPTRPPQEEAEQDGEEAGPEKEVFGFLTPHPVDDREFPRPQGDGPWRGALDLVADDLTPEFVPWYTSRDAYSDAVVASAAGRLDEAFDRWRDLFAAAEEQRDAARRTTDDYSTPYRENARRADAHARRPQGLSAL